MELDAHNAEGSTSKLGSYAKGNYFILGNNGLETTHGIFMAVTLTTYPEILVHRNYFTPLLPILLNVSD